MRSRWINQAVFTALLFGMTACQSQQTSSPVAPSAPTPPPPPVTGASITLSGTAFEHTAEGPRPAPNAALLVRVFAEAFVKVSSDATGRYSLSVVKGRSVSIAPAPGSGYYAPCPSGLSIVESDTTLDVHMVSAGVLSTAGRPSTMPLLGSIWVSGTVFEDTAAGVRPIAGASVDLAGSVSDPTADSTTLTDAGGRYVLCPAIPGTGTDISVMVRVHREGYQPASREALLGWDYAGVDIRLVRN